MSDIIQLLPDHVASQIAAGEVIQRPASALKELIENAVDAGASHIQVDIKNAGKTLIQVMDNGCGMSENDARLCWERHATSKIRTADELASVLTLGFRGEALASIAAIAQVEMKTKRRQDDAGTRIVIEGSELKTQETVATADGTVISVKNLFFNVPARRNFLKSNAAETRHLIDEFERQALAHPETGFSLQHDGNRIHHLTSGNLKQRILQLFGNAYNERLVPVEESTSALSISGFIIKPEFCKKSRGEQFFFINGRYIKDSYLHHAVTGAFSELLPPDAYASYFLFLRMNPSDIDVNIHPAKTEIKFKDERTVYQILKSAVKHALGKFSLMPSLDFDQDPALQLPAGKWKEIPRQPAVKINPAYNPFETEKNETATRRWMQIHNELQKESQQQTLTETLRPAGNPFEDLPDSAFFTAFGKYLLAITSDSIFIADAFSVRVRIYYEQLLLQALQERHSQQSLFPQLIEFSPSDFSLLAGILSELNRFGFDIAEFGKNTLRVNGFPAGFENADVRGLLGQILDDIRQDAPGIRVELHKHLARRLAHARARIATIPATSAETKALFIGLFNTEQPAYTPGGKKIFVRLGLNELHSLFNQTSS